MVFDWFVWCHAICGWFAFLMVLACCANFCFCRRGTFRPSDSREPLPLPFDAYLHRSKAENPRLIFIFTSNLSLRRKIMPALAYHFIKHIFISSKIYKKIIKFPHPNSSTFLKPYSFFNIRHLLPSPTIHVKPLTLLNPKSIGLPCRAF